MFTSFSSPLSFSLFFIYAFEIILVAMGSFICAHVFYIEKHNPLKVSAPDVRMDELKMSTVYPTTYTHMCNFKFWKNQHRMSLANIISIREQINRLTSREIFEKDHDEVIADDGKMMSYAADTLECLISKACFGFCVSN